MFDWIKHVSLRRDSRQDGAEAPSALVPVTGVAYDEEVVRLGCELLESSQGTLHILYVIEVAREYPLDAAMDSVYISGEKALAKMEEIASGYKCVSRAEIVQVRKTGAAIVREAALKQVDVIVMGSSYKEVYGVYSMDEHIAYTLKYAPCRVIVSREPLSFSARRAPSFERSI